MKTSLVALAAWSLLAAGSAHAQLPLQITARDDRPAPVNVRVEAKNSGGTVLLTTVVSWAADDNGWSTQPSVPLVIPRSASNLRLTFINDVGGGTPDTDRNAFIDSLTLSGVLREGETFDRTGGTDPMFPGCGSTTVDGRGCADCGNQNDWVEYDIPFSIAPRFCDASDGSLAFCPCSNPGKPHSGCDNAQATGGVIISALAQNTSPNGATITGTCFSTMGSPTAIVIRSALPNLPTPVVFGDGIRCIDDASGLVRLGAAPAVAGTSVHTFGHGVMAGSGARNYQIWYRNTPSSYCDPFAPFNLSNGLTLTW